MAVTPTPIQPVNPDGIADEMKAIDRWLLWHGVWIEGKGKYDKQPWSPDGYKWNAHDPTHWTSFEDAYDAHVADPDIISGIGFEPGYDEGSNLTFWFFDDDKRVHGVKPEPELQAILDGFPYGARELSPSGKGVRIFFATEGRAPYYHENPDGNKSELYNAGQFGTATGNEYQNNGFPFVAPMSAVEKLIDLAGLKPLHVGKNDSNAGNSSASNDEQAKQVTESDIKRVESYLTIIPVKDVSRDTWLKVGMALHSEGFEYGVWDKWSRMDPARYDDAQNRKTWESFGNYEAGEMLSFGYLVNLAYQYGWTPANPPVVSPFFMRKSVLWRNPKSKNGSEVRVTSTPPYILAKISDVDPGMPDRVRVGMDVPTKYKNSEPVTFVLNRSELFDRKVLYKTLTDLGGNLSESNAGYVVEYLTVCDGAPWAANIPRERSTSHMGWAGEPLGVFMPYDDGKEDVDISFDPPIDKARISTAFQEPKGSLEEWVELVAPLREKSVILRAMIAASVVSVLLETLGVQAFVVYVWGLSGSGKTVALKIAISIWGNPAEGAGYFAKLSDTDTAVFMRAGQLHNIPLVLDEFESIRKQTEEQKRRYFQHLAYDLSYGVERNRGNRAAKFNQGASWNLVTLAAGETPATGDTTQQGALNRIMELNGEPFNDKRIAQDAHRAIARQYGTAGRKLIEQLKDRDSDKMRAGFEGMRDTIAEALPDHLQVDMMAALAFGDMMAELFIFNPCGDYDDALEGAAKFAKKLARYTKGARDRDTDRRAIEYLAEWLATENAHFAEGKFTHDERIEPYGRVRESSGTTTWYVMGGKLKEALESVGFNREKTVLRMKREQIMADGQKQVKIGSDVPVWCYVIDGEALKRFLDSDDEVAEDEL